jgi:hypothetical protein
MHPGIPFPELKGDKDYTLVRNYNYYSTNPGTDEDQKKLPEFNRLLRKILLRDLKKAGLFAANTTNTRELSYLKLLALRLKLLQISRSFVLDYFSVSAI